MEISELLFELSHPTRLEILRLITETHRRLTKIADRVSANNPETSRHLERLRAAGLAEREPESAYLASPLGHFVLSSLSGLDFLARHSDYFRDPDLSLLPGPFVGRLGELKACERAEGIAPTVRRVRPGGLRIPIRSSEFDRIGDGALRLQKI